MQGHSLLQSNCRSEEGCGRGTREGRQAPTGTTG